MDKMWSWVLVSGLLAVASGCPDVKTDPNEVGSGGPIVEFDPSNKIIPFPNNLLLDRTTGKVNLPASCNESPASMATRVGVLNQLDGFGAFETVMTVTFTEPVDIMTVATNVALYRRATGTTEVDPSTAMSIPVVAVPSMTQRFDADCMNPVLVTQVILVPRVPLEQKSSYVVALKAGIKTAMGADYGPSFTWSLIRQEEPLVELDAMGNVISDRTPLDPSIPDDLASLQGIDLLWKAHAKAMTFLRGANLATEDVLLAWEFKTQTTTDPLDPAVTGSPAALAATTPALAGVARVNAGADGLQFLRAALPGRCQADAGPLPCQAVAEVLGGGLFAKQFQVLGPNPLGSGPMVPGMWADPILPPVVAGTAPLGVLITTSAVGCNAAAPGCPTIIFGHGLGSSRTSLFAIASQFAGAGYNSVAIDFASHGSRAVRINTTGPVCSDVGGVPPDPTTTLGASCYAPFLSPNLGATRDNIRQTVVDLHSLAAALKACGATACIGTGTGAFRVDPTRLLYAGISLGGIIGTMATATIPDIKAAVLNVPGVGWVDILENTQTLPIRCSLVNGLIDAGILVGEKWAGGATGLCTTDEWKAQAGYRQFSAIGRWILDPGDPANFARKLAPEKFLIQEVVGDLVVPNVATRNEGALVGLLSPTMLPGQADCNVGGSAASVAITGGMATPTTSKYVQYNNLAVGGTCAPGNTFTHSSLLAPAAGTDGSLGTARLQTDAITFLSLND